MAANGPHPGPLPLGEGEGPGPLPGGEASGEGRSLVVGLGNPILGDDGVGWRVAEEVARIVAERSLPVEVDSLAVGGLSLMERMVGHGRVVVVDAIRTGAGPVGTVTLFSLPNLPDPGAGHLGSAHDATLATALAAGRALGAALPDDRQVLIVAVESERVYDFADTLTPAVEAAVPRAVQLVLDALG